MRPILFTFRGTPVHRYSAALYLGLVAGTYSAYWAGTAGGLAGDPLAHAILALLVPAVLGARLAYVIGRWPEFRRAPLRILSPREGGAVAYGALLAVPMSFPLLLVLDIPVRRFWDAGAVGFLAAVVFLRVGCLLNGCCGHNRRIPVQLLEAAWAGALLAGAALVGPMRPGLLFLSLLAAYAAGRFVLGFMRLEPRRLGPLTTVQVVSAPLALVAVALLALAEWGWR